ncbi:methyltransferase [Marinobacter sp.]|uniref:methyltransferase n=1 Tax=Marinobacter sp. TaxID=50741 RepID=UPI002B4A2714|nr:methyltransferase [Marinobacter sp.]HKK56457.1 methyltransferase [Marinobacter sp.]
MALALASFSARWQHLNDWLSAHRELWQPAPFTGSSPEWTRRWPQLDRQVAGLSDEQCELFENEPVALAHRLMSMLPALAELPGMTRLPELADDALAQSCTLAEVRARDMPGRKRRQSGAFVAAVRPFDAPVLDWCCGKGHLARTLLPLSQYPVSGYDWNPALVDDGNRLARRAGDPVHLFCRDVMADDLNLPADAHAVALHACGDLHRRLISQAAKRRLSRLSVAPCCFHLCSQSDYRPLSRQARQWPGCLPVTRADLRLAVEETVTAPARVRNQVRLFSQWRLGFDGLQRQLRQLDQYLPVPSHPGWMAKADFRQFCRWAADKTRITLPEPVDYRAWEAYGAQRLAQVRRHELVRHLFRRPLELWLVMDYAVFLEEQGYEVRLGTFCDRNLTPRNLLIDATRKH